MNRVEFGAGVFNPDNETPDSLLEKMRGFPWLSPPKQPNPEELQALVDLNYRFWGDPSLPVSILQGDWKQAKEVCKQTWRANKKPIEWELTPLIRDIVIKKTRHLPPTDREVVLDLAQWISHDALEAWAQREAQIGFIAKFPSKLPKSNANVVPATALLEMFELGLWPIGPVSRRNWWKKWNRGRYGVPMPGNPVEFVVFIPPPQE